MVQSRGTTRLIDRPLSRGSSGLMRLSERPFSAGFGKFGGDSSAIGRQNPYEDWVSPDEHRDNLIDRFNATPLSYRKENGKTIASRSMAKGERPSSLGRWSKYSHLYGEGDLTSEWVLPGDAFDGPTNLQRQAPMSDAARTGAYNAGMSGTSRNVSQVNPGTYWPKSAFNIPLGSDGMPGFGRVDYTTGRWNMPPFSSVEPYGRFDTRKKTPPTISYPRRRFY